MIRSITVFFILHFLTDVKRSSESKKKSSLACRNGCYLFYVYLFKSDCSSLYGSTKCLLLIISNSFSLAFLLLIVYSCCNRFWDLGLS